MTDPVEEFFDGLAERGYEPLLQHNSGSIRFDVTDGARYPVQYPIACSPQAWSTGAPLLFLRTVLGLQPVGDQLVVDPSLPTDLGHLALLDIPGRWGRVDAYGRGKLTVDTTHGVSVGAAAR